MLNPAAATEIGTLGADVLLLDWVLTEEEGFSELWVRQADGTVGVLLLQAEGSSFGAVGDSELQAADLAELWVDADQDAALVGDGRQTWLFTHDGEGVVGPALKVPDAEAVALFDVPGPDSAEREADDGLDAP